jgi:hypothetical protein
MHVFLTATSGITKTIQVTFPAGTTIPDGAFFNEAEGIGPGTVSKSGQTITYTVTNAVAYLLVRKYDWSLQI